VLDQTAIAVETFETIWDAERQYALRRPVDPN
jgi:hypothetical protein